LLLALFGVLRGVRGSVTVEGRPASASSPRDAKRGAAPMALIPEDRKSEGLILSMSIADNLAMASLGRLSRGPFIDPARTRTRSAGRSSSCGSRSAIRRIRSRRCRAATSRRS
jgi:ribose transport system ATP-binding protein